MFRIGEELTSMLERGVVALERMAEALEEQSRLIAGEVQE